MLDAKKYLGEMLSERYLIKREIGRGASSIVFYAEDMMTPGEDGKPVPVAIKLLDKDSGEYKLNKKSFETEIRAVVNMPTNPHVVDIHDVSFHEREHYIVMEYVKGKTLRDLLREKGGKPFTAREIVSVSLQILQALRNAHEAGVVHRDIKPQNILVQSSAEAGSLAIPGGQDMPYIKLADFGIALLPDDDLMKMKDKSVGTVHYVSPEQASGGVIDHRSDLYSLGVVMYEMATAHVPFDAKSTTGIIQMHRFDEPFHVRNVNKEIPLKLDQIIFCAMQKNPADRFRDAATMEKQLKEVLRELSPTEGESVAASVERRAVVVEGDSWRGAKHKSDKERRPRESRGGKRPLRLPPFLVPALCAVLVVGLITTGLVLWLGGGTKEVTVPNLVGTPYAVTNAYPDGITVTVVEESNEETPAGVIFQQSPGGGAVISVDKNDRVQLTLHVSTGPATMSFSVPANKRNSVADLKEYLAENYKDASGQYPIVKVLRQEQADKADPSLPVGYVVELVTEMGEALDMDGDTIRAKAVTNVVVKVNPAATVTFRVPEIYRFSGDAAKDYVTENFPFFNVTVKEEIVTVMAVYEQIEGFNLLKEIINKDQIADYLDPTGNMYDVGTVVKAILADGTELSLDGAPYEVKGNGASLTLVCVQYRIVPQ